jgi:TonB family protein
MRKRLALSALALVMACSAVIGCNAPESSSADSASDTRGAIEVMYVREGDLPIHTRPADDSPIMATYSRGTSVSVLSHRGEWDEIRVADRSGWVHGKALANNAEAKQAEADNLSPRFRIPPAPVTSPGAHGEIDLEATVNQDGEVTGVTTTLNTTGSSNLVEKNINALRTARFEPIIQHGQRKPFTYEYRVHY